MTVHPKSRAFLAAIDLDGTLFGPDATVSPENLAALETLAARGGEVVIATGRHPANLADIATKLPMVEWLVGCQGCEVSDAARKVILERSFLPAGVASDIADAGHRAGFGVIAYTADAEIAPWMHPEITRYEDISKTKVHILPPERFAAESLFKIMWIADAARIDAMDSSAEALATRAKVDTVRSHEYVFEFVPRAVSKGTGVARLARELGIPREHVVAFGDADNDVPLFDWAGYSVAMPHARAHVRARATRTAPEGDPSTALARGVADFLAVRRPA